MLTFYELQLSDTLDKIQIISEQVASRLNQDCQCSLSAAYVTAAQLSCDPQEERDVIFRARISSTSEVSSTDFIIILQEWIRSGRALVAVEHVQLNVDAMCEVLLQSFSDPICSSSIVTSETPTTVPGVDIEKSSSTLSIVVPIVGAIAGGVVLILVVIIAIQIFNHCQRSRKYEFG